MKYASPVLPPSITLLDVLDEVVFLALDRTLSDPNEQDRHAENGGGLEPIHQWDSCHHAIS